jgi:hypothetical protein
MYGIRVVLHDEQYFTVPSTNLSHVLDGYFLSTFDIDLYMVCTRLSLIFKKLIFAVSARTRFSDATADDQL